MTSKPMGRPGPWSFDRLAVPLKAAHGQACRAFCITKMP